MPGDSRHIHVVSEIWVACRGLGAVVIAADSVCVAKITLHTCTRLTDTARQLVSSTERAFINATFWECN
jgi:hypothetical protein